jgi:hypothetical protein
MAIDGYSIVNHWWLLMVNLLMVISGYCIMSFFVIICYIMTIGDYFIINYCWINLFITIKYNSELC